MNRTPLPEGAAAISALTLVLMPLIQLSSGHQTQSRCALAQSIQSRCVQQIAHYGIAEAIAKQAYDERLTVSIWPLRRPIFRFLSSRGC